MSMFIGRFVAFCLFFIGFCNATQLQKDRWVTLVFQECGDFRIIHNRFFTKEFDKDSISKGTIEHYSIPSHHKPKRARMRGNGDMIDFRVDLLEQRAKSVLERGVLRLCKEINRFYDEVWSGKLDSLGEMLKGIKVDYASLKQDISRSDEVLDGCFQIVFDGFEAAVGEVDEMLKERVCIEKNNKELAPNMLNTVSFEYGKIKVGEAYGRGCNKWLWRMLEDEMKEHPRGEHLCIRFHTDEEIGEYIMLLDVTKKKWNKFSFFLFAKDKKGVWIRKLHLLLYGAPNSLPIQMVTKANFIPKCTRSLSTGDSIVLNYPMRMMLEEEYRMFKDGGEDENKIKKEFVDLRVRPYHHSNLGKYYNEALPILLHQEVNKVKLNFCVKKFPLGVKFGQLKGKICKRFNELGLPKKVRLEPKDVLLLVKRGYKDIPVGDGQKLEEVPNSITKTGVLVVFYFIVKFNPTLVFAKQGFRGWNGGLW